MKKQAKNTQKRKNTQLKGVKTGVKTRTTKTSANKRKTAPKKTGKVGLNKTHAQNTKNTAKNTKKRKVKAVTIYYA